MVGRDSIDGDIGTFDSDAVLGMINPAITPGLYIERGIIDIKEAVVPASLGKLRKLTSP